MEVIIGAEDFFDMEEAVLVVDEPVLKDVSALPHHQTILVSSALEEIAPILSESTRIYFPLSYYLLHYYKKDTEPLRSKEVYLYFDLQQHAFYPKLETFAHHEKHGGTLRLTRSWNAPYLNAYLISDLYVLQLLRGRCENLSSENDHDEELPELRAEGIYPGNLTVQLTYLTNTESKRTLAIEWNSRGESKAQELDFRETGLISRYKIATVKKTALRLDDEFMENLQHLMEFFPTED